MAHDPAADIGLTLGPIAGTKEIVTALSRPGHRLFQLAYTADIADAPLAKLLEVLKKRRILMLSAKMSSPDGKHSVWSVFLDSEDYGITIEGLRHMLEELDFMRDLRIAGGNSFIVDELFFPVTVSLGDRTMLISQEALQRMIGAMGEQFGSGGSVISYQEGVAIGSRWVAQLRSVFHGDLRTLIPEAIKLYSAMGIGRAEFIVASFDSLQFVLRLHHNIECEGKRTEKPNSQWIRGHLAGAAMAAFDAQLVCTETKCIAVGDPYCEFELKKQEGC
jgi:predicted hydrocarbon binding protein